MRRIFRIKRDSLVDLPLACCWRCRCLKQDGQDVLDGQDKEGGSVFAQCLTSC